MFWKFMVNTICFICVALILSVPRDVNANVTFYGQNLSGFNSAAGSPPVTIDFDTIASGTDITGSTINGIQFGANTAPLIVVNGWDTYTPGSSFSGAPNPDTNKLFPTSGDNVLSPGGLLLGPGPDAPIENDGLMLTFIIPVKAFGFDHLSQSADGASYTSIAVYDTANTLLYSNGIPISNLGGGGAPGGADFWGIVSDQYDIKKIVIQESDNNNTYPDCNIGYDTFRYFPATSVPEPSTMLLLGLGLVGVACIRTKFQN